MLIEVERLKQTENSVLGKLYIDGAFQCYTLEDTDRLSDGESKIAGKTAIPVGEYKVIKRFSPKFNIVTPYLLDVPEFSYVLIHWGNTSKDTDGCILVGEKLADNSIIGSRAAFKALMQKLAVVGEATIRIKNKVGNNARVSSTKTSRAG